MAERRMFSKSIVQGSRFLKMPVSSRELYFQMGMSADDDGIVEAWNVMKLTNAHEDDLRVLVSKGFVQILNGEDLIAYLTDWNINNSIRKDRYHEGIYKDLKLQIADGNQMSTNWQPVDNQLTTNCQPSDNQVTTEVSIDKVSIDKVSIDKGSKGGVGGTHTTTRTRNVDLFVDLEQGRLTSVYPSMIRWMTYKDEKKKKYTETGMKALITQVEKHVREYGADAVSECIEMSMANNYQGIIWDRLKNDRKGVSVFDMIREEERSRREQGRSDEDNSDPEVGVSDVLPWIDPR